MTYKNLRSRVLLILMSTIFISCSDDESGSEPVPVKPLNFFLTDIEEQFDEDGQLYLRAAFNRGQTDTVKTYGFIYTKALNGDNVHVDPKLGINQVVYSKNLAFDEDQNQYVFDAFINPERHADHVANNKAVVNVVAFMTAASGNTYVTETKWIAAPKPYIKSLYPLYASPGTLVTGVLNRYFTKGGLLDFNSDDFYKMTITIGEEVILFATDGPNFKFKMPEGVENEMPFKVTVGDYEIENDFTLRATDIGFNFLTKLNRDYSSSTLLFATQDGIYWGGGRKEEEDDPLTDFHKYDFNDQSWSPVADYPSNGLGRGMAFVIDGTAYCGTPQFLDRYDPAPDTWSRMPEPTTDLQYDYKFGDAAVGVYEGKAYFTNYDPEVEVGGIYYHNFHGYDPETGVFKVMPAYPGPDLESDYLDQAVLYNDLLHFFPGFQHWTFDVKNEVWAQRNDVAGSGRFVKPFTFKNELYLLKGYDRRYELYLSILKYDQVSDGWIKEADVPLDPNVTNAYILQVDPENIYLCKTTYDEDGLIIYKLQ